MPPLNQIYARLFVTEQLAFASLSMLTAGITDRRLTIEGVVDFVDSAVALLADDVASHGEALAYWHVIRPRYVALAAIENLDTPERPN